MAQSALRPYKDLVGSEEKELVLLAITLAQKAGRLLLDGLHDHRDVETKSSRTDVVTEMDGRSERLIVSGIQDARPNDAILAEEGSSISGTSGVTWVIDPLDGTVNYLYKLAPFAVSIAACRDSKAIAGVVYDPIHEETFTAVAGGGAYLNGVALQCPLVSDLGLSLIGTGFSYTAARRSAQAAVLPHLLPQVRDIRRAGAAAVDLCWVAAGRLNGFYEAGLQPWDLAAGELIVAEAGGCIQTLSGEADQHLPLAVASSKGIAEALVGILADCGALLIPR